MHAPIVHDCVGALLVRDGKLLLGRRGPDRRWLPDAWDVFGGHIEAGETPEQALRRELAEELGIVPLRCEYLGTLERESGESWRLRLYAVREWTGEPRNLQPREHAQLRWCALDEAQLRLAPAHPDFSGLLVRAVADEPAGTGH